MKKGLSDAEVWDLFRSGDKSAFSFIYQEYFDKLYNYGCQFTGDQALVEDALQELFLELWRRRRHLSQTDKILPYLYSAFRRKVIRNRDKKSRFTSLEAESTFPILFNIETSIIEDETQKAELQGLQEALGKLSERHREIIFLFYYENLSYEEIRDIQGFDHVKSARNLLYKALKSLKLKAKGLYLLIFIWLIVRM